MDLQSLLKIKLEKDLFNECNAYFKDESLHDKIQEIIKTKINENPISIDFTRKIVIKNNQCCARVMGPRYSDLRCPNSVNENIDYCKKHLNRINEYGYLSFGRCDESRPTINEKGNKIPWRDNSKMEDIDTIIQYQHTNLQKLIK